MRRGPLVFLALLTGIATLLPAQLPPPEATSRPAPVPPASQPAKAKSNDGELFPDIAPGTEYSQPKTKAASPKSTTRPAPLPATRPALSTTKPAATAPAFKATHRITLSNGRVLEGIPTRENHIVTIKMELGSISLDESKIDKIEPLPK